MINVAIQALVLLGGLLVNFLVPFLYGLEAYGAFIQAHILVFVFQKLADIINEPLIGHTEAAHVFPTAVVMGGIVWSVFTVIDQLLMPLGSPLLLAVMLASSTVSLGMYALRWQRTLLAYLAGFITLFFVLIALKEWAHWPLGIVDVLIWTNGLAILPVLVPLVLRTHWQGGGVLVTRALCAAPGNVSVTLVFNIFTNLLPFLLSRTLPHAELGLFRVMTSVVQSATSLFPVNTKALFVMFRRGIDAERLYEALLGAALAWFAAFGVGALALAWLIPRLAPFVDLVALLPVFYWAVLSERYLLAGGRRSLIVVINLVVGSVALALALGVRTLDEAVMLYAVSFTVYAACCLLPAAHGRVRWLALSLVLVMPFAVLLQVRYPAAVIAWQAALVVLAFSAFRLRPADLRLLEARL